MLQAAAELISGRGAVLCSVRDVMAPLAGVPDSSTTTAAPPLTVG